MLSQVTVAAVFNNVNDCYNCDNVVDSLISVKTSVLSIVSFVVSM